MRWITRSSILCFKRGFASEVKSGLEASDLPLISKPLEDKRVDEDDTTADRYSELKSPSEHRESHVVHLKQNLDSWISQQKSFPKGDEKDFQVFNILNHNPVRKNAPEYPQSISGLKFQDSTEEDRENVLNYFKELTRFSYPKKEKLTAKAIRQVYKKYRSLKTIQDEYLYYSVKKNNGESVSRLLRNKPTYYQRPSTYSYLLDMTSIFKNSKHSLASLRSLTKRLANNEIPISNELVYKLFYYLPVDASRFMLKQLEGKMDTRAVLDDVPYLRIESFDELKQKMIEDEVKFTYASYIQLSKLMVKENRVTEGLNFIQHMVFLHRVELPSALCKFTVDVVLANEPQLCIPVAVSMQRFTGCSLKLYATYRTTVILLASRVLTKETITLIKLLIKSSAWKAKLFTDDLLSNISLAANKQELLGYFSPENNDEEFVKLHEFFQSLYSTNDIAFKPGFDASMYEQIYKLFPTYKKFDIMRNELAQEGKNLSEEWVNNIAPYANTNRPLFSKLCKAVGDLLVERGQFEKIVPFVEYVKHVYHCNVEYDVYLSTFTKIVSLGAPDKGQLQLAQLLAHFLNLNHVTVVRAFIESHPTTKQVFDVVENTRNFKNLDMTWAVLVKETAWPLDGPPAL